MYLPIIANQPELDIISECIFETLKLRELTSVFELCLVVEKG